MMFCEQDSIRQEQGTTAVTLIWIFPDAAGSHAASEQIQWL